MAKALSHLVVYVTEGGDLYHEHFQSKAAANRFLAVMQSDEDPEEGNDTEECAAGSNYKALVINRYLKVEDRT